MNEIDNRFFVDLSDLFFDEKYASIKNLRLKSNHIQSKDTEIKKNLQNLHRDKFKNEEVNKDKKTDKLEIKDKPKEKEKKEDKLSQEIPSRESNKEKLIDSLYTKIDTFSSLNFLFDEKIKKVQSIDRSNNEFKNDKFDKEEFVEDYFSPNNFKSISGQDFKNNSEKSKKIDDTPKTKRDPDIIFKSPILNNNNNYYKNDKKGYNENRNESHKKLNFSSNHKDPISSYDIQKSGSDKSISIYFPNISLNNTNSHLMKISCANERNKKFENLLERNLKQEVSPSNDVTRININNNRKNESISNKPKDNQKFSSMKISHSQTYNQTNINLQKRPIEKVIPVCNFNDLHLSSLKEKIKTILNHNNQSRFNDSNQTESIDLSESFVSNKNNEQTPINPFFSFYIKTFEDPLLQKHLFNHPLLRLKFLKSYPSNKRLIAKDFLYNIVNGEVKNIYGKIKEREGQDKTCPKRSIYFIKLLKDKDVEEIYTKIYVTESVLKKKLNKKQISASFVEDELGLNISNTY